MKRFHKIVLVLVLIVAFFAFFMTAETGITGNAVKERPIQDIAQEMEDAGFERVANDPIEAVR